MKKEKIVFTSAVMDLFHIGHLKLFERASELGKLVVAIPTSDSNEIFKGHPTYYTFEQRLRIIQALKCVHLCLGYHSLEELQNLIKLIKPDIVCRGDDQKEFNGKKEAKEVGAKIVYFPYSKEISTTQIKKTNMHLKAMHTILEDVASILEKSKIKYWIDGGTLLGLYRDGRLIEFDHDLDFVIPYKELEKLNLDAFDGYDVFTTRINSRLISHDLFREGIGINLFAAYLDKWNINAYGIRDNDKRVIYKTPRKYCDKLYHVEYQGRKFPCPNNLDEYLAKKYGDWKVPNKNWQTTDDGFCRGIEKIKDDETIICNKYVQS